MKYEHESAQKENPEHMTLTKPLRHTKQTEFFPWKSDKKILQRI